MSMDKKQAARQAAAKYSTNPMEAAVEYGKLTEQIDPSFIFDESNMEHWKIVNELKQEMLELLPQYRHPANDMIAEWMIFFGHPEGPEINLEGHTDPEFLSRMKKKDTPTDTIEAVKKYVKEAELSKIELAECKDELEEYKKTFKKAFWEYNENRSERSDKRNRRVVQTLCLSTGHAPKRLNEKKIYRYYLILVRKKGMRRHEAVEKIVKLHKLKLNNLTLNTARKMLNDYRKDVLGKWKQEDPQNLPTIKKWLRGFVPPNR